MITLDDNHIYRVDGVIKPSVSEIIRPLSTEYYETMFGGFDGTAKLKKASERGTAIHEAIESFILFGIYDEEYTHYVEEFKRWMEENDIEVIQVEKSYTNGEYCGTLDLLVKEKGVITLVDIKATYKINMSLLEVQLAGYTELLLSNGIQVDKQKVLHLTKGKHKYKQVIINIWKWQSLKERYFNEKL